MVYSAHCRVQLSCNNFLEKSNRFTQSRPHRQSFTRIYAQAGSVDADVIVVGAGVAGLNCAAKLHSAGIPVILLEASDGVGGRVRTDKHPDGFLLDRGFQIFLTSYPEAREALDYTALDLRPFYAGALVRWAGDFHRVADPLRHFFDGLSSIPNPIGTPADKIKVGIFRLKSLLGSVDDIFAAPETTILEKLREERFSEAMIDRFFRPFLGGIFFDRDLGTTSRLFAFVMRMLATGQNCLPAQGIGAVSTQLSSKIPTTALRLNTPVASVSPGEAPDTTTNSDNLVFSHPKVTLQDGSTLTAKAIVVATEGPAAKALLGAALEAAPSSDASPVGTCCLYFAAPRPPRQGNILYLDGDGTAGCIVNNCCVPSEVSASYAPPGQSLISVSTLTTCPHLPDDEELQKKVKEELSEWFGKGETSSWTHLKTYRIGYAQPNQAPPTNAFRSEALGRGLWVAGDHRTTSTLDGALKSGRVAAELVAAELGVELGKSRT